MEKRTFWSISYNSKDYYVNVYCLLVMAVRNTFSSLKLKS